MIFCVLKYVPRNYVCVCAQACACASFNILLEIREAIGNDYLGGGKEGTQYFSGIRCVSTLLNSVTKRGRLWFIYNFLL